MSFKSWRSYWNFSNAIRNKSRYIFDEESKEFLNSLIETSESRIRTVKEGFILWRAQNGHDWEPMYQEDVHVDDIPSPYSPSRMKPLPDSAIEGRANPKGIPCLYLATDSDTAMSEVRPWLGSTISAGQFKVNRELKIVDFSVEHGSNNFHFYFEEPSDEEKLRAVWTDIDNAFSRPTEVSDTKSDYAPTQIISELIKSKEYDGIAYKSALAKGHNIVLFDLGSADLVNCFIYDVKNIDMEFKQSGNPYFV